MHQYYKPKLCKKRSAHNLLAFIDLVRFGDPYKFKYIFSIAKKYINYDWNALNEEKKRLKLKRKGWRVEKVPAIAAINIKITNWRDISNDKFELILTNHIQLKTNFLSACLKQIHKTYLR